jgi:hypothetical protein
VALGGFACQLRVAADGQSKSARTFGAPLAGFEPALTTPEADPACGSYPPEGSLAMPGGGIWGKELVWVICSMRTGHVTTQTSPSTAHGRVSGLHMDPITAPETVSITQLSLAER